MLGHLLGFDGGCEFGGKGEMLGCVLAVSWVGVLGDGTYRQRDIVKQEVKPSRSPDEVVSDKSADVFSLRDQLACVELCDYALQDLIHDAR